MAFSSTDLSAALTAIDSAIQKTLDALAYGIASRSKTNNRLTELMEARRQILDEMDAASRQVSLGRISTTT